MYKLIATAVLSLLLTVNIAAAQSVVKGKVMEQHTNIKLPGILVENQTQKVRTQTDSLGNYVIKAKAGDLLCFSGTSYVSDTVYLVGTTNLNIYMVLRSNQLKEVKVTQTEINMKGWSFPTEKGILNSKTFFYKPGGGLKIKIPASYELEKKRKKLEALESRGEIERQIARVFSAANLKEYVPLEGQEMKNFIIKFSPDVQTYESEKFNFADYVNASYKEFMKMPEDKRKSPTYFQLNGEN